MVQEQMRFLLNVAKLIEFAFDKNYTFTGGELFRTQAQQKIYFDSGLSKTMDSMHLKRLALDLNFFKDSELTDDLEYLKPLGEYWQSLSPKNRSGMFFKTIYDPGHFETYIP